MRLEEEKGCEGKVEWGWRKGSGVRERGWRKRRGVRGRDWRKRRVWFEEEKGCGVWGREGVRGWDWRREGCKRVGLEGERGCARVGWRKRV